MKSYKRIIAAAFLAAAVTSAFPAVTAGAEDAAPTVVFGKESKKSGLKSLKSSLYSINDEYDTPILTKSRTIKKCFVLKENEELIIPKGVTMTLNGGADIYGKIYIENGGKLVLKRYSVGLYGSIVSDGTISVTNGTLTCFAGSLLYVGEKGKFNCPSGYDAEVNEFTGQIWNDAQADTICLGKNTYNNPIFDGTPVAAVGYYYIRDGAQLEKLDNVEDLSKLLPGTVGYGTYSVWADDYYDAYTVMFAGGGTVKYVGNPEKGWKYIDDVPVSFYIAQLSKYRDPSIELDSIYDI